MEPREEGKWAETVLGRAWGTFGFSVTWERGCGPPSTLVGGATRREVELDASG